MIQVSGYGYVQENEWPIHEVIKWRMIKEGKITAWQLLDIPASTNLPGPYLFIKDSGKELLIWYHRVGICCPSDSRVWTTSITYENEKLIALRGRVYRGGLGQPCD